MTTIIAYTSRVSLFFNRKAIGTDIMRDNIGEAMTPRKK
jgi:hypothetical protein